MRTRKAHQITAAALYILQHRAYDHYTLISAGNGQPPIDFEAWCDERTWRCPQFQYWATAIALVICILIYVRSLREADFATYLDALTELVPCFFCTRPHKLCLLDTSASERYGLTIQETP